MKLKTLLGTVAGVSVSFAAMMAQAQTTVTIWGLDGDNDLVGTLAAEFDAANDDIIVDFRAIAFDELVPEALKAVATGNAPDIICLDNPDFAMFSSRGAMLDITDRVAASDIIDTSV